MVNQDNIRLFMTNVLDQAGQVVIIGEEVIEIDNSEVSDDHSAPLTARIRSYDPTIHLRHPLRLIANQGNVAVAALFAKEEWVKIPKAMAIEMDIHDKIRELYVKYEQEVFGAGIIMPEEKKIII